MAILKNTADLFKQTLTEWVDDKAPRLAAALAYYTTFSIGPLIIITITIAGKFFDNAQDQVLDQIGGLLGEKGSEAIAEMIEASRKPKTSAVATVLGFFTLIFGAAGVFVQLKDALNTIWNVKPMAKGGMKVFIKKYLLSFTMVFGIGFLLLVSLLLTAGLAAVGEVLGASLPGMEPLMKVLGFIVSFGLVTLLFAMIYKYIPDLHVAWRDVWIGAALTSFFFVVGKFGLGLYLGKSSVGSAYGAAGSLVIILLWVYYSAQILFFGAEFTQVYARKHGSHTLDQEGETGRALQIPKTRKQEVLEQSAKFRSELNEESHRLFGPKKNRKPLFGRRAKILDSPPRF